MCQASIPRKRLGRWSGRALRARDASRSRRACTRRSARASCEAFIHPPPIHTACAGSIGLLRSRARRQRCDVSATVLRVGAVEAPPSRGWPLRARQLSPRRSRFRQSGPAARCRTTGARPNRRWAAAAAHSVGSGRTPLPAAPAAPHPSTTDCGTARAARLGCIGRTSIGAADTTRFSSASRASQRLLVSCTAPMPIHPSVHLPNDLLIRLSDLAYLDNPISVHPPMCASRTSERFGVRGAAATVGSATHPKASTALHCSAAVGCAPPQQCATLPAADHSTE